MQLCYDMISSESSYSNPANANAFDVYNSNYHFFKQTNDVLISQIPINDFSVCLDIGCGTGIGIGSLLKKSNKSKKIVGIDSSPYMLEIAKQRYRYNPKIEFIEAKAEYMTQQLSENSVDVVTCNSALWQMDIEIIFHQVFSVLKKGGIFAFNIVEECLPKIRMLGTKNIFLQELFKLITDEYNVTPKIPWRDYCQYNLIDIHNKLRAADLRIIHSKAIKLYREPQELVTFLSMPRQSNRLFPNLSRNARDEILKNSADGYMKRKETALPFEFITYFVSQKI